MSAYLVPWLLPFYSFLSRWQTWTAFGFACTLSLGIFLKYELDNAPTPYRILSGLSSFSIKPTPFSITHFALIMQSLPLSPGLPHSFARPITLYMTTRLNSPTCFRLWFCTCACVSLPEAFSLLVLKNSWRLSLGVTFWLPLLIHPSWVSCPFCGFSLYLHRSYCVSCYPIGLLALWVPWAHN